MSVWPVLPRAAGVVAAIGVVVAGEVTKRRECFLDSFQIG
jgi:hypothetical protein